MTPFYVHQRIVSTAFRVRHARLAKAIPIPTPRSIPAILWLLAFALAFNGMVSVISFQARL